MADTLKRYTINGRPALLHPSCVEGFRTDRAVGLIYGPYRITNADGTQRWAMNAEEASVLGRFCPYCGQGE